MNQKSSDDDLDYNNLELKCGLEIHQQLDTKKLFCDCPSVLRSDEPFFYAVRELHPVAGEMGFVDVAALYQAYLGKRYAYEGYDTTCLVELDEEPPHQLNPEALKIALHIALLLHCEPLKATQIMRKTVLDGSNTSGFQRTVLIARNGFVETSFGRVGIAIVCLEEDAARIIEKKEDRVVYRLDRLGIPLIEIATNPDIKTPEQAKEAALHIGEILRVCKVKRGIGTIRQDVNVSIKDSARTELKGVQEPALIAKAINAEVRRQQGLLQSGKKPASEVRNALPSGESEFLRPMPGAARMYPETDLPLLRISKQMIDEVKRTLPRLASAYRTELRKEGLHEELIKLVLQEGKIGLLKELIPLRKDINLIVKMIALYPKEIASKRKIDMKIVEEKLEDDIFIKILKGINDGKIKENHVKEILEKVVDGTSIEEILMHEKQDEREIEEKVLDIVKRKPGLSVNAYMGLLMKELKGRVDGKMLMELIKRYVK